MGYWKNHTNRWSGCLDANNLPLYTPATLYNAVFTSAPIELDNLTLLDALNLGGGGIYNLARQSVAALLNICHEDVNYTAYTTAGLISAVNTAYANNTVANPTAGSLATDLDLLNNKGCPLGGSPATRPAVSTSASSGASPLASRTSGTLAISKPLTIHPNPVSAKATIEFVLANAQHYSLQIFDGKGRVVARVAAGIAEPGKHYSFQFSNSTLPEGLYMVRLITDKSTQITRMIMSR